MKDPTSLITLCSLDTTSSSGFTLRVSRDPIWSTREGVGFRIALNIRGGRALLNWIPIHSLLYVVWLSDSACIDKSRLKHQCFFVVSMYLSTDYRPPKVKDEFYLDLPLVLQNMLSLDVVVVGGDSNAQPGYRRETQSHIGNLFFLPVNCVNNGGRLTQACSDHMPFLANTNLCD